MSGKLVGWLAIAATLAATMTTAAAFAQTSNGGASISTAPTLPLGQTVTTGWDVQASVDNTGYYGEFWRLPLQTGDKLTIDWAQLSKSSGCDPGVYLRFYNQTVTDFTISQTQPSASLFSESVTKYEFTWVAPQAGNWTLFLYSGCARQFGYSLNATVQQFTTTTLAPPSTLVRTGARVRLHGSVSTVSSGNVMITIRGPKGWKPLAKVLPLAKGVFSFAFKPTRAGTYRVRASYSGDTTHRPSASKAYAIRAA